MIQDFTHGNVVLELSAAITVQYEPESDKNRNGSPFLLLKHAPKDVNPERWMWSFGADAELAGPPLEDRSCCGSLFNL